MSTSSISHHGIRAVLGVMFALLLSVGAAASAEPSAPPAFPQLHDREISWRGTLALGRTAFTFVDQGPLPGDATLDQATLGLQALSSSNESRTLFFGLDLRQDLGSELLATRLGVLAEWRPSWSFEPALAASWYFGDTIVMRSRDRQYNGDSLALSLAATLREVRVFAETRFGGYHEGPGFIFLPRRSGEESAGTRSFTVGVIIPIGTTCLPAQAAFRSARSD